MEDANIQKTDRGLEDTHEISEETRTNTENMLEISTPSTLTSGEDEQKTTDPLARGSNMRSRWKRKAIQTAKVPEPLPQTSAIGEIADLNSIDDAITNSNIPQPKASNHPTEEDQEETPTMTANNRKSGDSQRPKSGKPQNNNRRPRSSQQRSDKPQHSSRNRSHQGNRPNRPSNQASDPKKVVQSRKPAKKQTLVEKVSGIIASIFGTKKKTTKGLQQSSRPHSRPHSSDSRGNKKYARPQRHNQHNSQRKNRPPKA